MSEMMMQFAWLGPAVWQSTAALTAGLVGSHVLRRRPARAHQVLLLALIAAIAVPLLSYTVRQNQWGLFEATPTIIVANAAPSFEETNAQPAPETAVDAAAETFPVPMQVTPTPSRRGLTLDWARVAVGLWIAAGAALLLRLGFRFLLAFDLARRSEAVSGGRFDDVLRATRLRIGIKADVIVRSDRRVCSPVIWCWGKRPVLLVPHGASDGDGLDWPSIVCHELAHWKRHDHVTGLLAELMVCALPWQPLVWLARQRLTSLSEEACDDWVIAAGQTTTRYARTLLDLTPLGQAALVPGVVSSRKGLAARVRRIVGDRCGNPRSGRPWTFAAVLSTATLAAGIALAQTRPGTAPETIKTVLPHGAVIEQLADAAILTGVVLDPNGEPAHMPSGQIMILPMTTYAAKTDSNGQFELPWSPAWRSRTESLYLLVRAYERNLATLAEIGDLTVPLTIQLEPAVAVRGRVVDADSVPVRASLGLSLDLAFPCRTPVAVAGALPRDGGEFTLSAVPRSGTYRLRAAADGYQPGYFPVNLAESDGTTLDLGEIVLERQDTPQPAVAKQSPNPDWEATFQELYRLREGECIKFMKPPYTLERQDQIVEFMRGKVHSMDALLRDAPYLAAAFRWDGGLESGGGYAGRPSMELRGILTKFLRVPAYDLVIPDEISGIDVPQGDWVFRVRAPVEDKLRAMEQIVQWETGRVIRFEKRQTDRNVIVARGRYAFRSHPDGEYPDHVHVTWDGTLNGGGRTVDSLTELFKDIEDEIEIKIVDHTQPTEASGIQYRQSGKIRWIAHQPERRSERLPALLENLAKTTSLEFSVETRPAEVWFVTEDATAQ